MYSNSTFARCQCKINIKIIAEMTYPVPHPNSDVLSLTYLSLATKFSTDKVKQSPTRMPTPGNRKNILYHFIFCVLILMKVLQASVLHLY